MTDATKAILTKSLAILGFCVTVALIIWLIIMALGRLPSAFNSLASIADSVNLRKEISALEVTLEKTVVNSGEPFRVAWTDTKQDGIYRFVYPCAPGMTILFRDPEGTFRPMRCDEPLALPATVHALTLVASSTKDRFADVIFRAEFTESLDTTPITGSAKLTIVNAGIPVGGGAATSTATTTVVTKPVSPTSTSTQPAPKPVVPAQPITTLVYPQSDPNGFTDLALTIAPVTSAHGYATVRFTIKNLGTKTSSDWSFTADLPSGNEDYTSIQYAGLKPKEYMVFTMGFTVPERGNNRIEIDTHVSNDTNNANNSGSVNVSR
jgi:hypothetical protein